MEKQGKKHRKTWAQEDEALLVEVWADKLSQLRGQRRNSHIYKEMAEIIGGIYSPEEIKVKIHNLSNRYRKEKKLVGPSGGSPSEWGLYLKVHAILGNLRINNLEEVVEDSLMESLSPTPFPNVPDDSSLDISVICPDDPSPSSSTSNLLNGWKKNKKG